MIGYATCGEPADGSFSSHLKSTHSCVPITQSPRGSQDARRSHPVSDHVLIVLSPDWAVLLARSSSIAISRPILSDKCFCLPRTGWRAIGKPSFGWMIARAPFWHGTGIGPSRRASRSRANWWPASRQTDEFSVMPPPESREATDGRRDCQTLKQWIAEGAEYQQHWSLIAPERPEVPTVKKQSWVKTPVDAFILNRLEEEGVVPSDPANRQYAVATICHST